MKNQNTELVPVNKPLLLAVVYPEAERIQWRGVAAMAPYLIALGFVDALIYVVSILALIAGAVEFIAPLIRYAICRLWKAARRHALKVWAATNVCVMCASIVLGDWWRESLIFREEILAQDRAPE